jgi:hypothetical protein
MYERVNNMRNTDVKHHGEEDPPIYNSGFTNVIYKSYSSSNDEKREHLNGHRCNKNKSMKYLCMNNNQMWSQNDK